MTALMISNGEKKDIMELVKYLEKSSLLNKGVSKPKNEAKEKKETDFLTCYQVNQVIFCYEICQQVKGLSVLVKELQQQVDAISAGQDF